MIKVIDIFAGPGGLSEGFSAVKDTRGRCAFDVALSVEKDELAHATLQLRTFFRQFAESAPVDYYRFLRREIDLNDLYDLYPAEAKLAAARCWHAALGPDGAPATSVRRRIKRALKKSTSWVLIGGPPCQAYSIAGRSRNQGNPDYDPVKDVRQRLYVEYLQILAEHRPAVFIMENVKGLLSATLDNERIFHRILDDLRDPAAAVAREGRGGSYVRKGGYRIHSLIQDCVFENGNLEGSVIEAEKFGIPQARHRVILLGIRDDIGGAKPGLLTPQKFVSASSALKGLPRLRSGLSPNSKDSAQAWRDCLQDQVHRRWVNAGAKRIDSEALSRMLREQLRAIPLPDADRGGEYVRTEPTVGFAADWYLDSRIEGACNHGSRAHMPTDLFRYFYASCFAKLHGRSPSLKQFPTDLIPDHESADIAVENGGFFSDRFRVQIGSRPSSTIVSHISKDGHYYIYPDPLQCRSLTVREAARLQTFPDNYFFCGNRTSQYIQVGNAVPPLLARQIGETVCGFLNTVGAND